MSFIKKILLVTILLFATTIFSQKKWKLNTKITSEASASVYIPDMDVVAFISKTKINYVPVNEGDLITVNLSDYGSLPVGWNKITAAVKWDSSHIMLFNGITYIMLDITGPTLTPMGDLPGLPKSWKNQLDGAVEWGEEQLLFFKGKEFVIFSKDDGSVSKINTMNTWQGLNTSWATTSSVVNIDDGFIYFFNKNKYLKLNTETQEFVGGISKSSFGLPPVIKKFTDNSTVKNKETTKVDLENWCAIGVPKGTSEKDLLEDVTKSGGGNTGDFLEDTLPQGARVLEIRVWGNYVIEGIQTVVQTQEGATKELPVLGKKRGQTRTFKVPEGECITGVGGSFLGDYGDFVHDIYFKTTSSKSKKFGRRGRKQFKVDLAGAASFYGFKIKYKNYVSNIALKYVAYEGTVKKEEVIVDNNKNKNDSFNTNDYKGEYSDDHEDFMQTLIENQYGAADGQRMNLPAVEWLGKGVNILTLDPLKIGASETKETPITLITSNKTGGPQGKKQIPHGTDYKTVGSGTSSLKKSWVEKYGDFTTNFGTGIGVSVGTPVGGGSLSGSYKQMNNTKLGSEEIYLTQFVDRTLFNLNLDLKWRDRKTGKKLRQKLDFDFREKIDELPVVNSYPKLSYKNMSKKRKLPSQILKVKDEYMRIINQYGTHFIGNVDFGGKFVTSTRISKKDYETTRMKAMEFKAHAEGQIKMVKVGASASFDYGTKNVTGKKSGNVSTQHYVQGSNGETVFDTWNASLKESAVPIKVKLIPTYELLSKIFWPNDKNIQKKRDILRIITEKYQIDNNVKPKRSKGGFFSEPKALKYKYTLTIKSINCDAIDSGEPGSSNEVFGIVHTRYSQPGKKSTFKTEWKESEKNAVDMFKGQPFPVGKTHSVTLKEGDIKGGKFTVYAKFTEADGDFDANDSFGPQKNKSFKLSDFTLEPKDKKFTGFVNGGDRLSVTITIQKERVINFD